MKYPEDYINKIICGDVTKILKTFPDECIDMVMTSPPYWGLRDYGDDTAVIWDGDENCKHEWQNKDYKRRSNDTPASINRWNEKVFEELRRDKNISNAFCSKCGAWRGQLGLEPTIELYIKHLCDIFDEIKRVLKKEGTIWINLGDSYSSTAGGGVNIPTKVYKQSLSYSEHTKMIKSGEYQQLKTNIPAKSLCCIPERFMIEMINRDWILRNKIIWHKKNCMPSSAKDRFTADWEYILFFSKNKKYYFKQQFEEYKTSSILRAHYGSYSQKTDKGIHGGMTLRTQKKQFKKILRSTKIPQKDAELFGSPRARYYRMPPIGGKKQTEGNQNSTYSGNQPEWKQGANKRCVWTINTKGFSGAHFAVFSEELIQTPILAGCSENGIVLDPFIGSGTTGLVARKLGRNFIGIEIKKKYVEIARKRLAQEYLL